MGLNGTLYTAGRSLELFSAGVQVAGQNVANANTPGYIREQLYVSTNDPYESNGLLFGTGARENGIRQQLDYHLEQQIHASNADVSKAAARSEGYTQIELILSELGGSDLSTELNDFTSSIHEVINQPELLGNRQVVVQQGVQLTETIQKMREQIDLARNTLNQEVNGLVKEVNELVDAIAELNTQIVRMESGGLIDSQAGGLRSERLVALNRLSEIIPVRTVEQDNGIIDIFSGTDFLVINGNRQYIETTNTADRGVSINELQFSKTKSTAFIVGGELGGSIDARDNLLGGFADDLDLYTKSVMQEVNKIHSRGEGLVGYTNLTSTTQVEDTSLALNQAGLGLTPKHGSFEIKVFNQETGTTDTTRISIDLDGLGGNDTSLDDLQLAIDGIGNVSASLNHLGQMTLTADEGFEIRFSGDNSDTLAALGINTFFQGEDSNNIQVNAELQGNPRLFAASQGDGPGDNTNAIELAKFSENSTDLLEGISIDDFYSNMTATIANGASAETAVYDGFKAFQDSLLGLRQQNSGVSLDEEAIRIIELQQGYSAAARIISTVDELFTILLSI